MTAFAVVIPSDARDDTKGTTARDLPGGRGAQSLRRHRAVIGVCDSTHVFASGATGDAARDEVWDCHH